jgi:NTE family protein
MKITLALGGGGVRGMAHIGVLRALENHGLKVQAIAGTSAGGLVGAVYAAGFSTEKIEAAFNEVNYSQIFHRKRGEQPSILGMSGITKKLSELLADRTFDELEIPFAATAVNLYTGKEIILRKGKVIDAVKATIAIPGVFPNQELGGRVLVDGGVLDPVPVQVARWMRPDLPVVAVVLHRLPENYEEEDISLPIDLPGPISIVEQLSQLRPVQAFKIFTRSMEVTSKHLTELSMKLYKPEVIITPRVGNIGILQEINTEEMIQAGIEATEETMKEIKSESNWMKRIQRKVKHSFNPEPTPGFWEGIEEKHE